MKAAGALLDNPNKMRLRTRKPLVAAAAMACAAALVFGVAAPANAAGMKSITGTITCSAPPNISIGTSATARGTVDFQLNNTANTAYVYYTSMGYSSVYAPWSWKFLTGTAGNFYVYGLGSIGNVTAINRWCHNIFA